jgi:hypothetical protein
VHDEQEPEVPHSVLVLHSWMLVDPQDPGWHVEAAEGDEDCASPRQQNAPPSQSAPDVHPNVMHAPSAPHAWASGGAAS